MEIGVFWETAGLCRQCNHYHHVACECLFVPGKLKLGSSRCFVLLGLSSTLHEYYPEIWNSIFYSSQHMCMHSFFLFCTKMQQEDLVAQEILTVLYIFFFLKMQMNCNKFLSLILIRKITLALYRESRKWVWQGKVVLIRVLFLKACPKSVREIFFSPWKQIY